MDFESIRAVLAGYSDTRLIEAHGDVFAVYDPDADYEQRPRQGWATVVNSDVYDTFSDLGRPGVYRLNIGLPRPRFRELVDPDAEHDPTAIDVVFPHPVYAAYNWVSGLNPERTWPTVRGLLDEAHAFAARKRDNSARCRGRDEPAAARGPSEMAEQRFRRREVARGGVEPPTFRFSVPVPGGRCIWPCPTRTC